MFTLTDTKTCFKEPKYCPHSLSRHLKEWKHEENDNSMAHSAYDLLSTVIQNNISALYAQYQQFVCVTVEKGT